MSNNVIHISRGREIIQLNQQIEAARISFLLALVNPVKSGDTIKNRVERTRAFLLNQFVDSGYSEDEAHEYVKDAHSAAYVEFLKV
jgi:hypothetical protein